MEEFKDKLNEYMEAHGIKGTNEEENTTEDFKAGFYAANGALNIARVRLSCFQEVWQKWCEVDEMDFDKWLHDKLHEA